MNSIQEEELKHKQTAVTETRLAYESNVRGDRVMILVEGADDEKYYEQFASSQDAYIYSIGGCLHFTEILSALRPTFYPELCGIKDADFDHLNGNPAGIPNLFLTDCHDHEMGCVTPQKTTQLAMEMGIDQAKATTVHTKVCRKLENLSKVKWYCSMMREVYSRLEDHPLNVSFAHCHPVNCIGLNLSQTLDKINLNQEECRAYLNDKDVGRFLSRRPAPDWEQVLNGHDYCDILAQTIREIRPRNIKKNAIPKRLRAMHSQAEFRTTKLYADIRDYFQPRQVWK